MDKRFIEEGLPEPGIDTACFSDKRWFLGYSPGVESIGDLNKFPFSTEGDANNAKRLAEYYAQACVEAYKDRLVAHIHGYAAE